MTTERDDLSPAAIMARHAPMTDGPFVGWCAACPTSQRKRPCEPYRLAQALSQAQSELERIASHTRDAYDQRDAAQEALAASEAKVARVQAERDRWQKNGSAQVPLVKWYVWRPTYHAYMVSWQVIVDVLDRALADTASSPSVIDQEEA